MGRLQVAIVGCGDYMYNVLWPLMRALPVQLAGICDIDPAKLDRFEALYNVPGRYERYHDMLDKVRPDAVICAANATVHYEVAKACLEKGIHVFVEKTPCDTEAQARELADLAQQQGRVAMVGFNRRFATGHQMINHIVKDKAFGDPAMFYSKFNAGPYKSHEHFVFNHIIHHLDLAHYFLGDIKDISMRYRPVEEKKAAFIVDFTSVSGAIGTIQAACLPDEPLPMERIDIVGTSGQEVVLDNLRSLYHYRSGPRRTVKQVPLQPEGDTLAWVGNHGFAFGYHHMGFTEQMEAFVAAIETGKDHGCSIASCVPVMRDTEKLLGILKQYGKYSHSARNLRS